VVRAHRILRSFAVVPIEWPSGALGALVLSRNETKSTEISV
jgi:hypothetical protein